MVAPYRTPATLDPSVDIAPCAGPCNCVGVCARHAVVCLHTPCCHHEKTQDPAGPARAPSNPGGPWAKAVTVAALFLMSGATASAFALAWRISTAPPVHDAATRAQPAQIAAPPTMPVQHVPPRPRHAPSPAGALEREAARPLADAGPSIALRALGSPTHAPGELWARAVKLAAAGVDVVLTESSLAHRSVKEMEHELGPSAQIRPSADVGGVRIASLAPGSIARAAGLQEGDVVTAVNGYPLASPSDLLMAYASALEAQSAVLELRRGPRAVVLRLRIRA